MYSDQKFYTRKLVNVANNATSTSTATASGQTVTSTLVTTLPTFERRSEITGGRVVVRTAPNAGAGTTKVAILSGTTTVAVATVGTLTAGQDAAFGGFVALSTMAANTQPTVNVVSTSTASQTVTQGNYDIYLEITERYA